MIHIGEIGNFGGSLSKLKKILESASRRTNHAKYWFLVLAMFMAGIFGIFSWFPAGSIASSQLIDQKKTSDTDERCRWKKDVAFFSALESGRTTLQGEVVCTAPEEKRVAAIQERKEEGKEADADLDQTIRELAAGYPIEAMAPAIAKYDRDVAALIVGIAKKESNWGKRVPVDAEGKDCFNYWGFKGAGSRGVAMGHGCFGTPEEAVQAVGNRIAKLVELKQTSEPKNLTVWKCGSSCATHSRESVIKWVNDVDMYYRKIAKS